MHDLIPWLEAHDKLAGWAQFLGALVALAVTYFTAFAPIWGRKRQLQKAATRLLTHGYEAIESYHRTSGNFLPFAISLRGASISMGMVVEEFSRFPSYELDNQGSNSLARRIVAMGVLLRGLILFLDTTAESLEDRQATPEEHEFLLDFMKQQLANAQALIEGKVMTRPVWPGEPLATPQ